MLGFALVDQSSTATSTAIWLVSRIEAVRAGSTNAVCVKDDDPEAEGKIRSLVADRIVILTSDQPGQFFLETTMSFRDVSGLVDEVRAHRAAIVDAVRDYVKVSASKNLTPPGFSALPILPDLDQAECGSVQRALAAANFVSQIWTAWLQAEEQRRRRSVDPRTGLAPWMMPPELSATAISELPSSFMARHKLEQDGQC